MSLYIPIPKAHPTREALAVARRHLRRHAADRVGVEWTRTGSRVVVLPRVVEGRPDHKEASTRAHSEMVAAITEGLSGYEPWQPKGE